jgi:hypothetical protein
MKNIWSILCQSSSIDYETSAVSLFDCIEEIRLETDKIDKEGINLPANFQLVMAWQIEDKDKDLDIKIELIDPKGKKLKEFTNTYKVEQVSKRMRIRLAINGMQITGEGDHVFKISSKKGGKYIVGAELPLGVKCMEKK